MTIDLVITDADTLDAHSFRTLKSLLPHERQERSENYGRRVDRYTSVVAFAQLKKTVDGLRKLWTERHRHPLPVITGQVRETRIQQGFRPALQLAPRLDSVCVRVDPDTGGG